jgi:hypothetical protein
MLAETNLLGSLCKMRDTFAQFLPNLEFLDSFFFIEVPNIKLYQNLSIESHTDMCEWTDSHADADADRRIHRYEKGTGCFSRLHERVQKGIWEM